MVRPGFSHRRHRELVARRSLEAAAVRARARTAAMQAPDEDVEMTDVDTLPLSFEGSDINTKSLDLADAEFELRHLLEQEMARGPDSWISVNARSQEKLQQNLMMEVVKGDASEGELGEITLLSLLDVLIKLMNDGLQVDTIGL